MTHTLEVQVQEVKQLNQAEGVQSLKSELDATSNRASMQPDRRGEDRTVTDRKGFDRLNPHSGGAAQWTYLRFKWLSRVKATFETLTTELDGIKSEPKEPEVVGRVKIGPDEITTEEEWCSEQLYQLLAQNTEGACGPRDGAKPELAREAFGVLA